MTTAKRQYGLELLTEISSPVVESLVSVHGIMFMGSIGFNKSCRAYLNLNSVPHSFSKRETLCHYKRELEEAQGPTQIKLLLEIYKFP